MLPLGPALSRRRALPLRCTAGRGDALAGAAESQREIGASCAACVPPGALSQQGPGRRDEPFVDEPRLTRLRTCQISFQAAQCSHSTKQPALKACGIEEFANQLFCAFYTLTNLNA